ncbi:hypothetical protein C8R43DRAFT_953690 [Mycena crocata]|nr:hypothetical protein C8R43DRAFT_953690 [Mycena crocata]
MGRIRKFETESEGPLSGPVPGIGTTICTASPADLRSEPVSGHHLLTISRLKLSCGLRSSPPYSMDITEMNVGDISSRLQADIHALELDKASLLLKLGSVDASLSHLKAKYGRELNTLGDEHFEVLVSHVSSVWRDVAINTPSLWTFIQITPAKSSQTLAMYITRAKARFFLFPRLIKACSLDLRFDFTQEVWVPEQSIWDAILPNVDQWRSLTISTGPNDAMLYTTLAHLEPLRASLLEEMNILRQYHSTPISESALGPLQGFRNSLQCFHGGPVDAIVNAVPTPAPKVFAPELGQLSSLSIYGEVVAGKRPLDFEINLPHLRSLRIRGTTPLGNRASDLLLAISVPYLQSLTLFDMVYTDLDPFLSGFQLFQSLRSLTLYWPNFTMNTYIRLFGAMPSITRLTLMDRHPEDFLLLSHRSDFPQLEDFALYPGNTQHDRIEDMVRNRAAHAPLRILRLGSGLPVPEVQVVPFDLPAPWPAWPEQW